MTNEPKSKSRRKSPKNATLSRRFSDVLRSVRATVAQYDIEGKIVDCSKALKQLKKNLLLRTQQRKTSGKSKKWDQMLKKMSHDGTFARVQSLSAEYLQPQLHKLAQVLQEVLDMPSSDEILELHRKVTALDKKISEILAEDLPANETKVRSTHASHPTNLNS